MSKSRKNTVTGAPNSHRRDTTTATTSTSDSRIRKNHRGGVLITPDEIKLAFDFLDCDKSGKVSLANLKKRLAVFFPEMSAKEYRFMMNNKREMTLQDFNEMLLENEVTNFDPVAEAFKAYDVRGDGRITPEKLREVFASYGYGELSDSEVDVIIRAADVDGDGIISMEDFRYMLDMHKLPSLAQFGTASIPTVSSAPSRDRGDGKEKGNNGEFDR